MTQPIRVLHMLYGERSEELVDLLLNYARRMNPRYVCFDFYFLGSIPEEFTERADNLDSRIYSAMHIAEAFSKRRLMAFFREHPEYHIVHVHLEEQSAIALEAAQRAGISTRICHAHGQRKAKDRGWYLPAAGTRICRAATCLFADCVAVGEQLYGVNALEQILILPAFVDCDLLHWNPQQRKNVRDRLNIAHRTLVIGCFDPLLMRGEWDRFRTIVKHIREQFADSYLLLTGELQRQEQRRKKPLPASFSQDYTEYRKWLPALDVCLFPGNLLRIPYGLTEAQVAGIPCVISDRIPKEGVLSPLTCTLYCHRPAAQWAECTLLAAAQPRSSSRPEWAAEYDINRSAAWLERLYWEEGQKSLRKQTREKTENFVVQG